MKWLAYCRTCKAVLETASNSGWVEQVAKFHRKGNEVRNSDTDKMSPKGTKDCKVIVGYEV